MKTPNITDTIRHKFIKDTISNILTTAGLTFTLYSDSAKTNKAYPSIFGATIKFWQVSPVSGDKFDNALYTCNNFLIPYGLFLAMHYTVTASAGSSAKTAKLSLLVRNLPKLL